MPADQVPGNGEFLLYPNIAPILPAGQYTLTAAQSLEATSSTRGALPVDAMDVHLEVRSPRLTLPPDQVLSTFPPAESEGAYGSRLPQVVIKPAHAAVGAADRRRARPIDAVAGAGGGGGGRGEAGAERAGGGCDVTRGVTLAGGSMRTSPTAWRSGSRWCIAIFPTRKDVPLLAHARHVDIDDTELMMGDDDGFLAVVVAEPAAGEWPRCGGCRDAGEVHRLPGEPRRAVGPAAAHGAAAAPDQRAPGAGCARRALDARRWTSM